MTASTARKAGAPHAKAEFEARFSDKGALRQPCGEAGRVHIDRPLPFVVLARADDDREHSLAMHVATTSPNYLIWHEGDDDDALAALESVTERLCAEFDRVLLISLYDLPVPEARAEDSPELLDCAARIGAASDAFSQRAAIALDKAFSKIKVGLDSCGAKRGHKDRYEPGIDELVAGGKTLSHVSMGLPRSYLANDAETVYPQLFHDLSVAVFDAILKTACGFMDASGQKPPDHYRALGRSAFIDAAKKVDRQIDCICRSFDFLLGVSPINTEIAYRAFKKGDCEKPPVFHYRPLPMDPEVKKRELFEIDLNVVEDPVLEQLFSEKRLEVDQQLTMLEARGSERFRFASLMLYGPVETSLRQAAIAILHAIPDAGSSGGGRADCYQVRDGARALVDRYCEQDHRFDAKIELRDDIAAGMMVSADRLLISSDTNMPAHRVDPLLQHEVSVHLLTYLNGAQQGLRMFATGLAQYEGVQEGLGVFAEWAVGGLSKARLRLLAGRVLAVDAMIDGASFIDCFRLLRGSHGFTRRGAFSITARVYRSGGLAKDAIYLRGFKTVIDHVACGKSLDPYWYGKIAPQHVGIVEELGLRGLLQPPIFRPEFLERADAKKRIDALQPSPDLSTLIN